MMVTAFSYARKEAHVRQQFTMLVPMEYSISNNRMSPTWLRKKAKDGMQALTRDAAKDRYPVGKATIWVGIEKRTRGAYDPVNLTDTFKGCVDELVNMNILDEDDYHHVSGPWLYHAGIDKHIPARHMRATVTLETYYPKPF